MSKKTGFWSRLEKGDVVDVVAPSWGTPKEAIKPIIEWLESIGLEGRAQDKILGKDIYCANSIEERTKQLLQAIKNKDSKAIWCLRGGHGAAEMIPSLEKIKNPPAKLFIGFSDITALHAYFNKKWGWATIHGPVLNSMHKKEIVRRDVEEIKKVVFGEVTELNFSNLKPLSKNKTLKNETITGSLLGGNLAVFASLLGTPYFPDLKGKILFFEDVGERGYRVDRLLVQLEQAGVLKGVKAMVLGPFTQAEDPDGKTRVRQIFNKFSERQKFPVMSGVESGHGVRLRSVPLNAPAQLEIQGSGQVSLRCATGVNANKVIKTKNCMSNAKRNK